MITINVDKSEVEIEVRRHIAKLMESIDTECVFWDSKELKRRTCMSWDTIQATFFFDPRFPKRKVGGKWYYPVKETRAFLEEWLFEQPRNITVYTTE